jgi:hypothetical protein
MAENMDPSAEYPSLDLLYTETRDRIIRQGSTIEHINTKTSIIVGVDMVLLVAILGILASISSVVKDTKAVWQPWLIPTLALGSAVLALVSLVFSAIAFRPVTYKEVLDPRGAHDELICLEPAESQLQLLHTMIDSFEKTKKALDNNLSWFRASLWTLVVAMVVATIATGFYTYAIVWG